MGILTSNAIPAGGARARFCGVVFPPHAPFCAAAPPAQPDTQHEQILAAIFAPGRFTPDARIRRQSINQKTYNY